MVTSMRQRNSTALVDLNLVAAEEMVAKARHAVRDGLRLCVAEATAETAELIVSELMTNAIRHTKPGEAIRLKIWLRPDGLLHIQVSDTDPAPPPYVVAKELDESGRGLFLVRALSANYGWRRTASGKAIWALLAPSDTHPISGK
jgi:anti-sigma regulatory factor (Ser/Thr protein kinase)